MLMEILTYVIFCLSFLWLAYETDWLTIRLVYDTTPKPRARYRVYQSLTKRMGYGDGIHEGQNYKDGNNEPRYSQGDIDYKVFLSPGVDDVLCGFDWLDKHFDSMVNYQPQVEMNIGNVHYQMTIKKPELIKDIMRANKMTRRQVAELV